MLEHEEILTWRFAQGKLNLVYNLVQYFSLSSRILDNSRHAAYFMIVATYHTKHGGK